MTICKPKSAALTSNEDTAKTTSTLPDTGIDSDKEESKMNNSVTCKNYFKSGGTCTTVQDYTDVWIRLINQLERSKAALSGAR